VGVDNVISIQLKVLTFLLFCLTINPKATLAQADTWPNRPVKLVVPFAAGGATDIAARIIAPALGEILGQQFIVEIKSGAAGNIAIEYVAQSAPDGYTLLVGNVSTSSINETLFSSSLKVKPSVALKPVSLIASIPNLLVAGVNFPPNNMKELIAYAKMRPGELNYSSPLGGYSHLDMLDFNNKAGIKMVNIPSKGAGSSTVGLVAGDIHFTILNAASSLSLIKANKLKAIATTHANRLPYLPDVPTFAESGFPGVGTDQWNGIFIPANIPAPIMEKLFNATVQALQKPQVKEAFVTAGMTISPSKSPADAAAFVALETKRWPRIIKENNVNVNQ
jgi:tripartite-type tricarboxylate transporter receptor subunit TctC